MTLTEAKAYLARRNLSPESIKERTCGCRRCVDARRAEQLEVVKRAISGFSLRPKVTEIKRRAK